jgi:hypothetical protein
VFFLVGFLQFAVSRKNPEKCEQNRHSRGPFHFSGTFSMAKKRSLLDFGREFEALLTRAHSALASGQSEFTVQFDSPEIAHSVRFNTYAYFKALRNSADRPDLTAMCQSISMRLASSAVVFYRSIDSNAAMAIRTALQLPSTDSGVSISTAPASGLDGNLDRLRAIRERSDKG